MTIYFPPGATFLDVVAYLEIHFIQEQIEHCRLDFKTSERFVLWVPLNPHQAGLV